jgi:DNA segregation ATPase FtsK/SpoIIIE, S-DNA-T family
MATKTGKSSKKRPAKGKSRAPTSRSRPGGGTTLSSLGRTILRAEVVGTALVLVAVFTLLSLLTSSRSQLTDGWVDLLRSLFGVGVWWIPILTGAMGLWLVVRAIERMPNVPWQRPVGTSLLFLAFIMAVALLTPSALRTQLALEGDGGGQVGTLFADAFEGILGSWGAWAMVAFLVICGIIFVADRLLVDGWFALTDWYGRRGVNGPAPSLSPAPPLKPPVPLPSGQLPWWKRLFPPKVENDIFLPPPGDNLVRPDPARAFGEGTTRGPSPVGPHAPVAPPSATAAAAAAGSWTAPQPTAEADLLNPRIVGGAQDWKLPQLGAVLNDWERVTDSDELIRDQGRLIQETLALFGVPADFEGAYKGPSVTQYLIKPGYIERKVGTENQRIKVKVAKIAALSNDLALALAAPSVRIEAPIPGTNYVGVEVPNQASNVVGLKELMESDTFADMKGRLRLALGEDVKGQAVVSDLTRMPHLLIAGATGSGKSVCINSIIAGLLLTNTPDMLRMLMVDPKMVELSVYNGVPHLLSPVVTEVDRAAAVLFWAVKEMERRYALFSKANTRDLPRYNVYLQRNGEKALPYIVVIVDEMADLMMAAPEEVEKHICRLAQMARAVGIHLIIATQRPSVDVITGLIKANFPARIAFAVTSQTDSRVILDVPGAERLLGRGDMLFMAPDASKLERIQGTYLSDDEINKLVRYWKGIRAYEAGPAQSGGEGPMAPELNTLEPPPKAVPRASPSMGSSSSTLPPGPLSQPPLFEQIEAMKAADARDDLFDEAVKIVQEHGRGSVSLLQRKLRIGYSRAARLVDQLEEAGVLGPDQGASRGREILPGEAPTAGSPPSTKPRIIGGEEDEGATPPRIWM